MPIQNYKGLHFSQKPWLVALLFLVLLFNPSSSSGLRSQCPNWGTHVLVPENSPISLRESSTSLAPFNLEYPFAYVLFWELATHVSFGVNIKKSYGELRSEVNFAQNYIKDKVPVKKVTKLTVTEITEQDEREMLLMNLVSYSKSKGIAKIMTTWVADTNRNLLGVKGYPIKLIHWSFLDEFEREIQKKCSESMICKDYYARIFEPLSEIGELMTSNLPLLNCVLQKNKSKLPESFFLITSKGLITEELFSFPKINVVPLFLAFLNSEKYLSKIIPSMSSQAFEQRAAFHGFFEFFARIQLFKGDAVVMRLPEECEVHLKTGDYGLKRVEREELWSEWGLSIRGNSLFDPIDVLYENIREVQDPEFHEVIASLKATPRQSPKVSKQLIFGSMKGADLTKVHEFISTSRHFHPKAEIVIEIESAQIQNYELLQSFKQNSIKTIEPSIRFTENAAYPDCYFSRAMTLYDFLLGHPEYQEVLLTSTENVFFQSNIFKENPFYSKSLDSLVAAEAGEYFMTNPSWIDSFAASFNPLLPSLLSSALRINPKVVLGTREAFLKHLSYCFYFLFDELDSKKLDQCSLDEEVCLEFSNYFVQDLVKVDLVPNGFYMLHANKHTEKRISLVNGKIHYIEMAPSVFIDLQTDSIKVV